MIFHRSEEKAISNASISTVSAIQRFVKKNYLMVRISAPYFRHGLSQTYLKFLSAAVRLLG